MKLSRSYYESLLYDLLKPFVNLYDEAESSIIIPNEIEVSYDTRTMRLESFSRSLLGWSMLPGHEDIKRVIFTMIKNGINSKCNKYWGEIYDNDQKIVEIFPILLYCIENRNLFESLFDEQSRNNLQEWCLQINKVQVPINNWQFFIVLVNTFLRILGLKYSKNSIEHAFENIEKCTSAMDGIATEIVCNVIIIFLLLCIIIHYFMQNIVQKTNAQLLS